MNTLLNGMKNATNFKLTENGGVSHKTTRSDLLDLFAMGAAMRERSDEDCILMFQKAYTENPVYALKFLFYIRDVRGGQGERRFFRVVLRWLAAYDADAVIRNIKLIPEYGRWDDLYCLFGTRCQQNAAQLMKEQLALDLECKTPSLLAKWLKSENASSAESNRLGDMTRRYFGMSHREYRKTLSYLRQKINIVERLMSENRWDEIEFDKIPSKAGLIYKNAFARRDIIKAKYEKFAKDETTKVNASTLYPYEVVKKAIEVMDSDHCWYNHQAIPMDDTDRLMVNKYWDNLTDYFNGASLNALCMVDTSGSMTSNDRLPISVATSLGLYCAEKGKGPFAGHYISFSSRPQLIATEGVDFCDKVDRIVRTDLCENTNIEAAFDLVLNTAIRNRCTQDALPEHILVISDMEFDQATGYRNYARSIESALNTNTAETVMESIERKFNAAGYQMPKLVFWNVDARHNNIPMLGQGYVSYVSGFSPSIFQSIITGKTGYELMMECLNKERYAPIQ